MVYWKRKNLVVVTSVAALVLLFVLLNTSSQLADPKPLDPEIKDTPVKPAAVDNEQVKIRVMEGQDSLDPLDAGSVDLIPFMPKMTNETLKAELGRASWRLFHTILARYPEAPSTVEKDTLSQYIQLFSKVYPCGDCARHFAKLLQKYPPQLSNRQVASVWGCHVHNKVNERLGKQEYDCSNILEDYDCGCGADEAELDNSVEEDHLFFELNKEEKQLG